MTFELWISQQKQHRWAKNLCRTSSAPSNMLTRVCVCAVKYGVKQDVPNHSEQFYSFYLLIGRTRTLYRKSWSFVIINDQIGAWNENRFDFLFFTVHLMHRNTSNFGNSVRNWKYCCKIVIGANAKNDLYPSAGNWTEQALWNINK